MGMEYRPFFVYSLPPKKWVGFPIYNLLSKMVGILQEGAPLVVKVAITPTNPMKNHGCE